MFYKILADIINTEILKTEKNSENIEEKLKTCYWKMECEERVKTLKGIFEFVDNNVELYIFILSYFLQVLNDFKIVELIENVILTEEQLSLLDKINLSYQLREYMFKSKYVETETGRNEIKRSIYEKQVCSAMEKINSTISYIPLKNRNKNRIVMLIEPLLGKRHAPTRKLVNIYSYFERLGYEVYVYATNYRFVQMPRIAWWWNASVSNTLFEENTEFRIKYYNVEIRGCYVMYTDENYVESIKAVREEIQQINPMFVMTMGDSNILGDTCNEFVDVVTMGCTSHVPLTMSNMIASYFNLTEDIRQVCMRQLCSKQKVIEYIHTEEISEQEEQEYTRQQLRINEDDFVIIIAGTRLDDEVKQDTIDVLYTILNKESKCKILFIGNCDKLKEKLSSKTFYQQLRFIKNTRNFKMAIKLGDLFLNPPRTGGGTGALYAVQCNIPVLTLGHCDVANMGEAFICEKLEDMPKIVHRYVTDLEFMERQKRECEKKVRKTCLIDNLKQTEQFCKEVEMTIKEKERLLEE